MGYAYWLAPFGWGMFFVGLIISIIIFAIKRKFYPVMYLVSVATYIFTVGFAIDIFELSKEGILLTLAFSALVFILLGFYFSYKFNRKKQDFAERIPSRR